MYEKRKPAEEQNADKLRHNQKKLAVLLPRLEQQLDGCDYLMGEHGIADLSFTPFLTLAERAGVDCGPFPNLAAWHPRLKQRPSYEEVKIGFTA